MALYRYIKKNKLSVLETPAKRGPKIFALAAVGLGAFLLANALWPIVHYQLFLSPRFGRTFISPDEQAAIAQSFGVAPAADEKAKFLKIGGANEKDLFAKTQTAQETLLSSSEKGNYQNEVKFVLGEKTNLNDLTKPENTNLTPTELNEEEKIIFYTLSIPKLKIFDAKVRVGLELKESLAQYPGTAIPGKLGNTVIFGHSVLPIFFNPKNYLTIFSTLPTLQPKDEIYINFNQIKYKYVVEQMIEVTPDDVSILAQRYDDSYLSLITCVPPGTYLKRLIVRARLAKY